MTTTSHTGPESPPDLLVADRRHRLHWFAGRSHEVLDTLAETSTWAMTETERDETLTELLALQARIQQRVLTLVADADRADAATAAGASSTVGWLRSITRETPRCLSRLVKDARALESRPATNAALAAGVINPDQATAITGALDALPDEVANQIPVAERHLLVEARTHDAVGLRTLGKHLLEVIAPDHADELINRRLEAEEEAARRKTSLTMWDNGDGTTSGTFKLPTLHGLILKKLVESFANPQRPDSPAATDPTSNRTAPQVRGDAFCQLLEAIPTDWVPSSGGTHLTVVVTMTLETLMGGLKSAGILGEDHRISAAEARRLACTAGVIPTVLGGNSEVLDLGRKNRLHTRPQRLAMALNQGGHCAVEHCDRPATWADAHHLTLWSEGGQTTVDDGALICARHHTLAHDNRFEVQRLGTGKLRFHPRT